MTAFTPDQIIAVPTDGGTYYLVPADAFGHPSWGATTTWSTADGTVLQDVRPNGNRAGGWRRGDGPVQDLVARRPGRKTRTGWRLKDPDAASAKFPLDISNDAAAGYYDGEIEALYSPVHDTAPDEVATFPAAGMLVVDDATPPPPADGLVWTVNIRDELRQHPELFFLFPGHLTGFRQAVADAANALPVVGSGYLDGARVDRERPSEVRVSTAVPYEPRTTRFVHDTGRNGQRLKRGKTVVETKRMDVTLSLPDRIPGRNRAEAKAAWDAALAEVLATITEALTPAPCRHCNGTGVVGRSSDAAVREPQ